MTFFLALKKTHAKAYQHLLLLSSTFAWRLFCFGHLDNSGNCGGVVGLSRTEEHFSSGWVGIHPGRVSIHSGRVSIHSGRVSTRPGRISIHSGRISIHSGRVSIHSGMISTLSLEI